MPLASDLSVTFRPVSLLDHTRTNGDLGFWIWEEGEELTGLLQRSTDLFDASTVLRMYRHLERLLAAGAADPGLRLSDLPLLSAAEAAQILVEWNRPGERESQLDGLVHERFERWAEVRPDAVALETADRSEVLTYAELNRRGNRLAHRLRRLGVGTDSIVGIWAERSVEFVAGMLGVLKAGGAYMPLDPSLPADRLAAIVRGSGISVLLARDGKPLVAKGYGYANLEWQIPNTPDTKFRIGSITKQFTSMLIMQLREAGKLEIEDSVCMYVTPCPEAWKPVTIHHLLTHTSGIPSYTGLAEWRKVNMVPKTIDEMIEAGAIRAGSRVNDPTELSAFTDAARNANRRIRPLSCASTSSFLRLDTSTS